jgi:hypothetical protein
MQDSLIPITTQYQFLHLLIGSKRVTSGDIDDWRRVIEQGRYWTSQRKFFSWSRTIVVKEAAVKLSKFSLPQVYGKFSLNVNFYEWNYAVAIDIKDGTEFSTDSLSYSKQSGLYWRPFSRAQIRSQLRPKRAQTIYTADQQISTKQCK